MSSRIINEQKISCAWLGYPNHYGVDLISNISIAQGGTPKIKAHSDGYVYKLWYNTGSYGYCIEIMHANGYRTVYAHLSKFEVALNEKVSKGQVIGIMGSSGTSHMHLHFEVKNPAGSKINPTPYLNADLPNMPDEDVPAKGNVYIVQAGDTMTSIANMYKMELDELLELNPQITNPNVISVGQEINVDVPYETGRYEVIANVLTVRTGAGTSFAWKKFEELTKNAQEQILKLNNNVKVNGYVKGIVCDVTEISADKVWGKTLSGWICLDYCKKI